MAKKLSNEQIMNIVNAVLLIVLGILFCISLAVAEYTISIILGVGLLVVGIIFIVLSISNSKSLLTASGFIGAVLLGLGIMFIVTNVIGYLFSAIPYLLTTIGAIIFADAFIGYFVRKDKNALALALKLLIGAALIAIGICMLTVEDFAGYVGLIFGIALIIIGLYMLIAVFVGKKMSKSSK